MQWSWIRWRGRGGKLPFLSVTIYQQDYYRNVLSETGMTRYVEHSKKEKIFIIFGFG